VGGGVGCLVWFGDDYNCGNLPEGVMGAKFKGCVEDPDKQPVVHMPGPFEGAVEDATNAWGREV